ncbi:hypothetical protein VTH06DRAFT_3595 [Thermothelomyces fergusii]
METTETPIHSDPVADGQLIHQNNESLLKPGLSATHIENAFPALSFPPNSRRTPTDCSYRRLGRQKKREATKNRVRGWKREKRRKKEKKKGHQSPALLSLC